MERLPASYMFLLLFGLMLVTAQENSIGANSTETDDEGTPQLPAYPLDVQFNVSLPMAVVNVGTTMPNATYEKSYNYTNFNETNYLSGIRALDAAVGGNPTVAVGNVGFSTAPVITTAQTFAGVDSTSSGGFQPPDQALCVSRDWVYELNNNVVAIFDAKNGQQVMAPMSQQAFFQIAANTAPANHVFDPRCVYDEESQAIFFVTDFDRGGPNPPAVGDNGNLGSMLAIFAVIPTLLDPLAGRTPTYLVNNDRTDYPPGSQVGTICLTANCWGDYPTLAVDRTYIWSSVNMYSTLFVAGPMGRPTQTYRGSIIYGLTKAQVFAGAPNVNTLLFDSSTLGSTVQPSITQFGSPYPTAAGNVDAVFFTTLRTNQVCIGAIVNAQAIPPATAMNFMGPVLCRALLGTVQTLQFNPLGGPAIPPLDSVAIKMQQTPFMRGTIWGAFNTEVTVGGVKQDGVGYFNTAFLSATPAAIFYTIGTFGYLGLTGNSVQVPAIAPFPDEPTTAVLAVSVGGPGTQMTHGYSIIRTAGQGIASTIHLVSTSGTLTAGTNRYGDYSAAAVAPDSSIWIAGMTSSPANLNWATWITQVKRGGAPPIARCKTPITISATNGGCTVVQTEAALIALIDAGTTSAGGPLKLSLQPKPDLPFSVAYTLTAGHTYTFTLVAANSAGKDTCEAFVTVADVPKPVAICNPFVTLPAQTKCAAQITAAALTTAVTAAIINGPGDAVTSVLQPLSPTGTYDLPVGTYDINLKVSNCAGSDFCTSIVTVADQEDIQADKISCGTLPADGVVETPLLTKTKSVPVSVFQPAYIKTNGCPATVTADNLVCRNCLLGSNKQQEGILGHCDSSITSAGVGIGPTQLGRVSWTVTATDKAGHEATANCAICADHGDKAVTTLGHCPKPFTAATTCDFGNL